MYVDKNWRFSVSTLLQPLHPLSPSVCFFNSSVLLGIYVRNTLKHRVVSSV